MSNKSSENVTQHLCLRGKATRNINKAEWPVKSFISAHGTVGLHIFVNIMTFMFTIFYHSQLLEEVEAYQIRVWEYHRVRGNLTDYGMRSIAIRLSKQNKTFCGFVIFPMRIKNRIEQIICIILRAWFFSCCRRNVYVMHASALGSWKGIFTLLREYQTRINKWKNTNWDKMRLCYDIPALQAWKKTKNLFCLMGTLVLISTVCK